MQIKANKPDMVLMKLKEKKMIIVEMSCPGEQNIVEKETEKRQKHVDLCMQLKKSYPEYNITFVALIIIGRHHGKFSCKSTKHRYP